LSGGIEWPQPAKFTPKIQAAEVKNLKGRMLIVIKRPQVTRTAGELGAELEADFVSAPRSNDPPRSHNQNAR
jgi:hypothetical protein